MRKYLDFWIWICKNSLYRIMEALEIQTHKIILHDLKVFIILRYKVKKSNKEQNVLLFYFQIFTNAKHSHTLSWLAARLLSAEDDETSGGLSALVLWALLREFRGWLLSLSLLSLLLSSLCDTRRPCLVWDLDGLSDSFLTSVFSSTFSWTFFSSL